MQSRALKEIPLFTYTDVSSSVHIAIRALRNTLYHINSL